MTNFKSKLEKSVSGTPAHIFAWGGGLGMNCKSIWEYPRMPVVGRLYGVRGGAPETFSNPRLIVQQETPCLNINMHPVLVENGR